MANANAVNNLALADDARSAVGLRPMTVAEAFRDTFNALLAAPGLKGIEIAERAGISPATISKMKSGTRGASFAMLEKVRRAFHLQPPDLFDADRALTALGLRRIPDTSASEHAPTAHNNDLEIARGPQVWSAPEPALGEGAIVPQDPEMFRAMAELWNGLSTAHRASLLAEASRLKKARSVGTAAS